MILCTSSPSKEQGDWEGKLRGINLGLPYPLLLYIFQTWKLVLCEVVNYLLHLPTKGVINCRYVTIAPEGHHILKDKVSRLFPTDDSTPQEPGRHVSSVETIPTNSHKIDSISICLAGNVLGLFLKSPDLQANQNDETAYLR